MVNAALPPKKFINRLIMYPAIITLVITLLRLTGELLRCRRLCSARLKAAALRSSASAGCPSSSDRILPSNCLTAT